MGWRIHQMNVKIVFLNGIIEEEVYIEQPEGFETFDRESHVCRLKRTLYGLKQAPCAWYTRIDNYFTRLGFTKSEADANLYQIVVEGKLLIIVLYVDDLILTGDEQLIHSCKEDLAKELEMKDLGLLHYLLGLEIWQRMVNFLCLKESMQERYWVSFTRRDANLWILLFQETRGKRMLLLER